MTVLSVPSHTRAQVAARQRIRLRPAAAVSFTLQKSANGLVWQHISGSRLTVIAGKSRTQRTLGVGSRLSASSFGQGSRGYRYDRLMATAEAAQRFTPVARTMPADVAIHFDISWEADEGWADIVGEGR
jgi:hypothetical protein